MIQKQIDEFESLEWWDLSRRGLLKCDVCGKVIKSAFWDGKRHICSDCNLKEAEERARGAQE